MLLNKHDRIFISKSSGNCVYSNWFELTRFENSCVLKIPQMLTHKIMTTTTMMTNEHLCWCCMSELPSKSKTQNLRMNCFCAVITCSHNNRMLNMKCFRIYLNLEIPMELIWPWFVDNTEKKSYASLSNSPSSSC